MNLYLDDIRDAPDGWVRVKDLETAKDYLKQGLVDQCSLDHDLGACEACMGGRTADDWLRDSSFTEMPNCTHVGTGYDLCLWMAEYGHWPKRKPLVHSANPPGRERMQGVINRYFPETVQ